MKRALIFPLAAALCLAGLAKEVTIRVLWTVGTGAGWIVTITTDAVWRIEGKR